MRAPVLYFPAVYVGTAATIDAALCRAFRDSASPEVIEKIRAAWRNEQLVVEFPGVEDARLVLMPTQAGEVGQCRMFYMYGRGRAVEADAETEAEAAAVENRAGKGPFGLAPWFVFEIWETGGMQ